MNILTFVISFSILSAIAFNSLFFQVLSMKKAKTGYVAYFHTKRNLQNTYVKKTYDQIPHFKNLSKQKKDPFNVKKPLRFKKSEPYPPCAKFNLGSLALDSSPNPISYELFAKLLRILYHDNLFQNLEKKIEYTLIDHLLVACKNFKHTHPLNEISLPKLSLDNKHLQRIYYHMLKGTNNYSLEEKIGYPSLLDYVKIAPLHEKTCLQCASKEILSLFLDPKLANTLWSLKEQNIERLPIKKEKLEKLLQEKNPYTQQVISTLVDTSHKKNLLLEITISAKDDHSTNLQLKRKIPCRAFKDLETEEAPL